MLPVIDIYWPANIFIGNKKLGVPPWKKCCEKLGQVVDWELLNCEETLYIGQGHWR